MMQFTNCSKYLLTPLGIWLALSACAASGDVATPKADTLPELPFTAESFKAFADPDDYQRFFQLTPYVGKEKDMNYINRFSVILQEKPVVVNRHLTTYQLPGWTQIRSSLGDEVSEIIAMQSSEAWNSDGNLVALYVDPMRKEDWQLLTNFPDLKAVGSTNFHGSEVNVDTHWFNAQWHTIFLHGRKLSHVNDLCNFKKLKYFAATASYPQQSVHFTKECQAPLVYLGFREARLDNIEIAGPQSLVHLDLFQADIHNIKLHGDTLPNLEFVDLREANLPEDVSQIQFPSHLKQLSLIAQTDPATTQLVLPENLQYLNLRKAQLADYRFITAAKNLESLNLSESNFHQWHLLKAFPNLKHLHLSGAPVTQDAIEIIAELPELERLNLGGANIQSVLPLAKLKHLQFLLLSSTNITDLNNIPDFPQLKYLATPKNYYLKDISGLPAHIQRMLNLTDPFDYDTKGGLICLERPECSPPPWLLPKQ